MRQQLLKHILYLDIWIVIQWSSTYTLDGLIWYQCFTFVKSTLTLFLPSYFCKTFKVVPQMRVTATILYLHLNPKY